MAHEGLCTHRLGSVHPVHGSPHVAGFVQVVGCAIAIIICALLDVDPYSVVFAWAGSLASIGILAMQIATAASVAGYYLIFKPNGSKWRWLVSSVVSGAALTACLILVTINLDLVSGTSSSLIFVLPVLVFLAALFGWRRALQLKRNEPTRYAVLGFS